MCYLLCFNIKTTATKERTNFGYRIVVNCRTFSLLRFRDFDLSGLGTPVFRWSLSRRSTIT